MTDYVIKRTELSKGMTLGEYIKLKGLTEKNWILIFDEFESKLLTGVRADGLTLSEKNYYIVTVCNYIFPQYTVHSERPYYIVVTVSKTPINFNPIVYTETEVKAPEPPVEDGEEQENSELTPTEKKQADELTLLEIILFEEHNKSLSNFIAFSNMANEAEDKEVFETYLFKASVANCLYDYTLTVIRRAFLIDKYSAWLQERKKQEALTVL